MMAHPHDDIEAFALGGVDELTARRVLEHADQCPTCAILLAEAMNTVSVLEPAGERPLAEPVDLSGALRSGARSKRPAFAPMSNWMLRASAFAAAAAIFAMGIWNLNIRSRIPVVPIASLVHSHFEHHALHGATGNAKVIQALDGRWLYLIGDGLFPNTRYELHETVAGNVRKVGEFTTSASGQATAYWEQPPVRIQRFVVSAVDSNHGAPELRWP